MVAQLRRQMQETWVQTLVQEDPLEKEMATHSSTLAWKVSQRSLAKATVRGVANSRTWRSDGAQAHRSLNYLSPWKGLTGQAASCGHRAALATSSWLTLSDKGFTHSSQAGAKGGRDRVKLTYQVFFPVSLPYAWSCRFKFKSKETIDQKQEVAALRIPRFCLGFCAPTAEGLSSIPDQRNTILRGTKEKKKKGNWYLVPLVPLSLGHLGTLAASHPSHSTTGKGLRTRGCWGSHRNYWVF